MRVCLCIKHDMFRESLSIDERVCVCVDFCLRRELKFLILNTNFAKMFTVLCKFAQAFAASNCFLLTIHDFGDPKINFIVQHSILYNF